MYDVKSDFIKNRLHLVLKGGVTETEFKSFILTAVQTAEKLKPGFDVTTDISEFVVMSETLRLLLVDLMKSIKNMKVRHVVRIINPRAAMVSLQWQRSSWKVGYLAENVTSFVDANRKLDELERKVSIMNVPAVI